MAEDKFTVLYSCHGCCLTAASCDVPMRRKTENVVEWLDRIRPTLGLDHARRSPLCRSMECDLKIPITGEHLGRPAEH